MMKNKVRDKLLRFIHALIDVLMCIVALLWTAIDPGLLEKYFPRQACTLIHIIIIMGLSVFLVCLYDAWNELAQTRKECRYGKDI